MPDEFPILFDFPEDLDLHRADRPTSERELPVVPLINIVLFPHMLTPLFVGRERSISAVEEAMNRDRTFLAVAQRDADLSEVGPGELFTIGVEATIQRVLKMPDGSTSIVVQGVRRMRVLDYPQEAPTLHARAVPIYGDDEKTIAVEAMMRAVLSLFEKVVKLSRTLPDDAYVMAMNVDEPGWLADLIASTLPIEVVQRQEILETLDPEERLRRLSIMLSQELDVLELETRIHSQVQREVDRSQREFFLREQLKAIQRELGQDDPQQREILDLRDRVMAANMSEVAQNKALDELNRMESMPTASPEYSIVRTYLDWLLDLPWHNQTEDSTDLRSAAQILEQNHYGLERVKERILEFLAVRRLAGERMKAPILCFVGPPGVGKTSLGRSIAAALGRQFVRISLGGVHDEAEIRGHRRTYIGALPGRVIKAMKEAKTINPVFMLDEIDKLGADFRGDPAAALLEVLDPEQNYDFTDHYLDVPYSLARVMFIATANLIDPIPPALLDRMEVIHLPGYTEDEKLQIARRFLVPKQVVSNGLSNEAPPIEAPPVAKNGKPPSMPETPRLVQFSDTALRLMIREYTREAGVRNLEREIGTVCRKIARRVAEGQAYNSQVLPKSLPRYLGGPRFSHGTAGQRDEVGAAIGLSWTARGGDIMTIEVTLMKGKGRLTLTGQLGDVMRESAQAALSFARTNADRLGIKNKRFEWSDIHIHVPEGAVPKEGPSAGITLATALISALVGQPVRRDVAMTGEITLRGKVLPVGGIKEKVLGAHRAGVTTVILPQQNKRDIDEVPPHIRRQLTFLFVEHVDEVLQAAFRESIFKRSPEPEEVKRLTPTKVRRRSISEEPEIDDGEQDVVM
jgi:ATP-dependent Lon protease